MYERTQAGGLGDRHAGKQACSGQAGCRRRLHNDTNPPFPPPHTHTPMEVGTVATTWLIGPSRSDIHAAPASLLLVPTAPPCQH